MSKLTYKASGVDTEKADALVADYRALAQGTCQKGVLSGVGGFSGFYALPPGYRQPVLTACTDGVGTKLRLLIDYNQPRWAGMDAAAMCLNDLATSGAKPLFMLDYLACGKLDSDFARQVVAGIAEYCTQSGCALLGGETAEMPGFYPPGDLDVAGFALGVVERDEIIDGSRCRPGDVVLGLSSSGLHSNGFSLIRLLIDQGLLEPDREYPDLPGPLWHHLLQPTRLYTGIAAELTEACNPGAFAHITGGGLPGNAGRTLPPGLDMVLDKPWPQTPLYALLRSTGVAGEEMFKTFNMGVGFTVTVAENQVNQALGLAAARGCKAWPIGSLVSGSGQVILNV